VEPIDNRFSDNSLREIALTSSFRPAVLATNPLEHGLGFYRQELTHNPVSRTIILANGFEALAGQWHIIIDGHLSWKQWGRLAQTCKALNDEFGLRMKSKLYGDSQLELKKNPDDRGVLINVFRCPGNRVVPPILINQQDIYYIQQELGINCGPNRLIAIKKGLLSTENAKQRLKEPVQDLRARFHYLNDVDFLVIQKYCADEFFLVEKLTNLFPEYLAESLTELLQPLTLSVQFHIDCIALESDQPVQINDLGIFFEMLQEPKILALLNEGVVSAAQLLTVTHTRSIDALCNEDLIQLVRRELISIAQCVMLSQLNFRESDAQSFKQLAALMQRPEHPLQAGQFFNLHITGQQLLCRTALCSLIQSDQIPLDAFLTLSEVNQKKLHAYWDILAPLMHPNRLQPYTLKQVVDVITDEINFKVLSTLMTKELNVLGRLPIEAILELPDTDKKRLYESDTLREIFISSDKVKFTEFFKLPSLIQQFLETNWWDLWDQLDNQKLTWEQIKNSSPEDLLVFEHSGADEYVTHVNGK